MGASEDETTTTECAGDNARPQPIMGCSLGRQSVKLSQGARNSATGHGWWNLSGAIPAILITLAAQPLMIYHYSLSLNSVTQRGTDADAVDGFGRWRWRMRPPAENSP